LTGKDEFLTNDVAFHADDHQDGGDARRHAARPEVERTGTGPRSSVPSSSDAGYCSWGHTGCRTPGSTVTSTTNNQMGGGSGARRPQVPGRGAADRPHGTGSLAFIPWVFRLRMPTATATLGDRRGTGGVGIRQYRGGGQGVGWGTHPTGGIIFTATASRALSSHPSPSASFGTVKLNGDGGVDILTSAVEHGRGHTPSCHRSWRPNRAASGPPCRHAGHSVTPFDRSSTSSRTTFPWAMRFTGSRRCASATGKLAGAYSGYTRRLRL
jgi:hypothetical protein